MKWNKLKISSKDFLQLSKLGSMANLSFTTHQIVGNKLFGVDAIKKKVVILEKKGRKTMSYIINLNDVISVTFKKVYNQIKAGILRKKRIEDFIQSISLEFKLKESNQIITLPFYENSINPKKDLYLLEKKVRDWQEIFSKLSTRISSPKDTAKDIMYTKFPASEMFNKPAVLNMS